MICKDEEENLAHCLASVAHHVDEIVIVDTGSTDRTREVAVKFGASVYQFDQHNHPEAFFRDDEETCKKFGAPPPYSGEITLGNFAAARRESFERSTGDFVVWFDADDVVEGAEHLRRTVNDLATRGMDFGFFPYDYCRDHLGRVFYRQWRERMVRRGSANWVNAVHEVLLPARTVIPVRYSEIIVAHRRKADRKSTPNRNYKLLLRELLRLKTERPNDAIDPRTLFYLGQESRFIEPMRAMGFYEEYLKTSGWDEERAAAHVAIGSLFEMGMVPGFPADEAYARANKEFATAAAEAAENPDGVFGLARIAYLRGRWNDCIRYSERGFKIGNTDSMLGANPMDRLYRPHIYYNHALAHVGRTEEAAASCRVALAVCPDDPGVPGGASGMLAYNLKFYEEQMKPAPPPTPQATPAGWIEFDVNEDIETPAAQLPKDTLVIWAMQLWKQCVAAGDGRRAFNLLDSLPPAIGDNAAIVRMRASTERRFPSVIGDRPILLHEKHPAALGGHPAPLSVVFYLGPGPEAWDPTTPNKKGLGGSETAAIEMAKHLVALGHAVKVYAEVDGIFDGVEYVRQEKFRGADCDVFIASRSPWSVEYFGPVRARLKLLWVHDIHVGVPSNPQLERWLLKFDRILCLSVWHKGYFQSVYPTVHPDRVIVTRNGIDPARFAPTEVGGPLYTCKKNHLVFSSSPNRGLAQLVPNFQNIIKPRIPDAELHIYYGFDTWETLAKGRNNPEELAEIAQYKAILPPVGQSAGGIFNHGKQPQSVIADAYLQSKVWLYYTGFAETYCITALEAQAAGCVPVCSALAALTETVKHGFLIDNDAPGAASVLVETAIRLMQHEDERAPIAKFGRAWAMTQSWQALAADWSKMFDVLLGEVAENPVPLWRSA